MCVMSLSSRRKSKVQRDRGIIVRGLNALKYVGRF